jgi:hypothetical protein
MKLPIGRIAAIAIPLVTATALLSGGSPPALAQTTPTSPHPIGHKSVTVQFPADQLRAMLKGLRIAQIGKPGTAIPLDSSPNCPAGWNEGELNVTWTYDTTTRLTFASNAVWHEGLHCVNMAFEQVASSLFTNGSLAQDGTTQTCGTQGSPVNNCFFGGVVSTGTRSCAGGPGACALTYQMTASVWVQLPAGWFWPTPAPAGCFDDASQTTMICGFSTNPINVPVLN